MRVILTVAESPPAVLTVPAESAVTLTAETYISVDTTTPYSGPYEWTPTQDMQTIEINGLKAIENITINPIPSNYGLITWNGSTLTVS